MNFLERLAMIRSEEGEGDGGGGDDGGGNSDSGNNESFDDFDESPLDDGSEDDPLDKKIDDPDEEEMPSDNTDKKAKKSKKKDDEENNVSNKSEGEDEEDITDYVKASFEDTDYNLHPDASFQLDEEGDPVSINDLIDGYKQYQGFNSQREEFEDSQENFSSERRNYQDKLDDARRVTHEYDRLKASAKEDPVGSFYEVLDSLGINSHNGFKALSDAIFPNLQEAVNELDGAEFQNYLLHNQNRFMEEFNGVRDQRFQRGQDQSRIEGELNHCRNKYGLSDGAMKDAYREMALKSEKGFEFKGGLVPETISQYALQRYVDTQAPALLEKIQEGLGEDREVLNQTVKLMDELRQGRNNDFTEDDLVNIAAELVEAFDINLDDEPDPKNKKVQKNSGKRKTVTTKKKKVSEDESFDDFNDEDEEFF